MKYLIAAVLLMAAQFSLAIDAGKSLEEALKAYSKRSVDAFIPALLKDSS